MDQRTLGVLVDRGVMDAQRVTARPTIRTCKTCGRAVLVALADDGPDVPGIRTTLEVRPLTTYGELVALTAGALTFAVRGGHVAWRAPTDITRTPADQAQVHASHSCTPAPGIEYREIPRRMNIALADPAVIPF